MSTTLERIRRDALRVDKLMATGEGALGPEEKRRLAEMMRAESPESSGMIDQALFRKIDQLEKACQQSRSNLQKLEKLFDRLVAPPWTAAVFVRMVDTAEGRRAMVSHGVARRVVNLADDVDPADLEMGDEVFLNGETNIVIAKSADGPPRVGETAKFDRYTQDGRLVIQSRDELLIVEAAGPLAGFELSRDDEVRWDRSAWMAYERIERAAGRRRAWSEVPDARREQVGGQRHGLTTLLDRLVGRFKDPEAAALYGQNGKNAVLMVGPPGCGKTLIARVAGGEVARSMGKQCQFAVVKPAEWWDPFVGVSEQNIRNCFRDLGEAAEENGLAMLFLDEVNSVGRVRGSGVGHHGDRFLDALLAELDGFKDRGDVAIIAATNRKDLCDPALLERFDVEIAIGRPDAQGAREIFEIHLPESMPYSPNGDLAAATRHEAVDRAVSRLYSPNGENEVCVIRFRDGSERIVAARELMSGRQIEQICRAARQSAFSRYVDSGEHGLRVEDVEKAVAEAVHRLSSALTPRNAHAYLSDLPQDMDVVAVTPIARRAGHDHQYLNVD